MLESFCLTLAAETLFLKKKIVLVHDSSSVGMLALSCGVPKCTIPSIPPWPLENFPGAPRFYPTFDKIPCHYNVLQLFKQASLLSKREAFYFSYDVKNFGPDDVDRIPNCRLLTLTSHDRSLSFHRLLRSAGRARHQQKIIFMLFAGLFHTAYQATQFYRQRNG